MLLCVRQNRENIQECVVRVTEIKREGIFEYMVCARETNESVLECVRKIKREGERR